MKKITITIFIFVILIPVAAHADRIWVSGFELNSLADEFTSTTGSAMTVESSVVRSGSYAAEVNGLASGTRSGVFVQLNNGAAFAFRFYLRVDTPPSAENRIFEPTNSISQQNVYVTLGSDSKLRFYASNGTLVGTSNALSSGQWYRVEMNFPTTAPDTYDFYVDGVFQGSTQTDTVTPNGVFLGGNGNAEAQTTGTWYFDDLAANDTNQTVAGKDDGLPGPGSLAIVRPNGAGDSTTWTISGSSPAATNFQGVNEVTPDDGVTYNQSTSATNGLRDMFTVDSATTAGIGAKDEIRGVFVGARVGSDSTTSTGRTLVLNLESQGSGTVASSTSIAVNVNGFSTNGTASSLPTYKLVSYNTPQNSSNQWTPSLINTMQIGYSDNNTSTNAVRVSDLWAYIEYLPCRNVCVPSYVRGAIDSTNGSSAHNTTFNSGSGGNSRILVVGYINHDPSLTNRTISSVTYNGSNLNLATSTDNTTENDRCEIWYLVNPTTGSNTLTTNYGGTISSTEGLSDIYISVYDNVNQKNPVNTIGTAIANSATSITTSLNTLFTNDMLVDVVNASTTAATISPNQTSFGAQFNQNNIGENFGSYKWGDYAKSDSMSATTASSDFLTECSVALEPVAIPPRLGLTSGILKLLSGKLIIK